MHGIISEFLTVPGKRDEFIGILAQATQAMPGCLAYVIAKDAGRDDAVWVTEVWADQQSHAASLALPAVQQALQQGRPLIASMGTRAETVPMAGA